MRILIADDDAVCRHLLERTLTAFGHEVVSAKDGAEAWAKYLGGHAPLVILDWMMPGLDGVDVCRQIREHEKSRPESYSYVIFLTVRSQTNDLVEGMTAGADDFMTKPFDRSELQVRVQAGIRIIGLRDRLWKANQQLIEAGQLKTEFVNMAVHDLGSPLTSLRSYLEFMGDGLLGELNAEQKVVVTRMLRSEQLLESFRADMLDVLRFEQGAMDFEKSPQDIRELTGSALAELAPMAASKEQQVSCDVPSLRANLDPRRIRQVITNYVSNAIRYTGRGGRISVAAQRVDGYIRLSVQDTGRGIAPADLNRVFTAFGRTGEKVEGSTGLGLAIVKKIVEAHGGQVGCESEPGQGSTFHFTVPVA